MGKQRSSCDEAARRAWRVLRLALLWARKGGLLKCRLVAELRHMPKYLKRHHKVSRDMIRYGERELSFDETPVLHFRMNRSHHGSLWFMMPCIKPEVVDFDYEFGDDCGGYEDVGYGGYGARRSLKNNVDDCSTENDGGNVECEEQGVVCEDEGIDVKAEEFIANFYSQIKMQKQISFQQRQARKLAI